jgi:hypothetical protein
MNDMMKIVAAVAYSVLLGGAVGIDPYAGPRGEKSP